MSDFTRQRRWVLYALAVAGSGAMLGPSVKAHADPVGDHPVVAKEKNDPAGDAAFATHRFESRRHRTTWIEAGPVAGPLMMFIHGWPGLGIVWRRQIERFAKTGWRCVAPDMRGYGGSSVPAGSSAYQLSEIVADMIELHDALGGAPALWVGQDWGAPVVGALAAHHPARCRGVVNISIPYLPHGFALANLVALVDRTLYPAATYPLGQWDYYAFYRESFDQAARDFEADVAATMAVLYRPGSPDATGKPAATATVRARGGRFGATHRAPPTPRDPTMMSEADFETLVEAFKTTGFRGPDAWYLNDEANIAYCTQAPDDGRLNLPVLFLGGGWDPICDVKRGRLAGPMRASCGDLTEAVIDGGHWLMLEQADAVNDAMAAWLSAKRLG
jgi:pimeloyl-ACP methyl ester carboxylesterase